MYPNKAPPSAAPTMIPGEESTKNKNIPFDQFSVYLN